MAMSDIKQQARIELAKRKFFRYCNLMTPKFYKPNRQYLIDLCDEMEAIKDLIWLKEQARNSILNEAFDEGYVRQGTSTAYVNAIKELNALEDVYPDKTQNININGELNNPFGGLTTEQLARLADGYE